MRPFLIPIAGAILLLIGIVIILTNKDLATVALVFEIAGVVLLGFYMVKEMLPGRTKRKR
ncbi:hypothetical protein [Paramicrobacterium fandaimingii]|uniref:hypothetical protein n=1 Tax=Paramicrobacterium fandaimingii TaxID=2708079 RepID=UPI001422417E|nr:hypothetical protein [Microbacterium fandaimingii]